MKLPEEFWFGAAITAIILAGMSVIGYDLKTKNETNRIKAREQAKVCVELIKQGQCTGCKLLK